MAKKPLTKKPAKKAAKKGAKKAGKKKSRSAKGSVPKSEPAPSRKGKGKGGPKTAAGKEKAKKNLIPFSGADDPRRWKNGPSCGATIKNYYNTLYEKTQAELIEIATDDDAPVAKLMAARSMIRALNPEWGKGGKPFASDDLSRIMEHTDGRPHQTVEHSGSIDTGEDQALRAARGYRDNLQRLQKGEAAASVYGSDVPEARVEGSGNGPSRPEKA